MEVKTHLFCLCLFVASAAALWDKLQIENCGTPNDVVVVQNMSISPMPLPIPGNIIITGNVSIKQNLPKNTKVHLKMYRVTKVIWEIDIKIPCIGGVGSCSHDICELIKTSDGLFCHFFPPGRSCDCPIYKGNYTTKNLSYKTPPLGGIASWFAKGNYKVQVVIKDEGAGKQLGCFQIKLSLGTN